MKTNNQQESLALAKKSLVGLSVGDAFGETFFGEPEIVKQRIASKQLVDRQWKFTDDTVMAIGIYKILERYGEIRQNELATVFAHNHSLDMMRGYGGMAHNILNAIARGEDWEIIAKSIFDGTGSMGNGAAMRVAPLGAYFYKDPEAIVKQAAISAEVTHYHKEGVAGAVAVASAAGLMVQWKLENRHYNATEFIESILQYTPESTTKRLIRKSLDIKADADINAVVQMLSNGSKVTAQDTVPLCIWIIAHFCHSYEAALWQAVSALGDRDTIAAIVGSVVVLNHEIADIPGTWLHHTEPLEQSVFWPQRL